MAKRILYLTQWFEPEIAPRGLKFTEGLVAHGYDVEVATGFPNYPSGKIAPGYRLSFYQLEIMRGIRVNRTYLYPSHDRSSLSRAINYISFFVSATIFCIVRGRSFDAIYVYHPPITVGLAAALSSYVTKRPFLIEIQDLWPDSVVASKMSGAGVLARMLDPVCRFVYGRAALVLGQSRTMTERLIERGVPHSKAATTFNWADEEAVRNGGDHDLTYLEFQGHFNFVYGGNLGSVQGLETLVRAACLASRTVPEIQLTLIGDGLERDSLAALIAQLGAEVVKLRSGVSQSQIGGVFAAADVLVAHLLDDPLFEITIPSKTQFYMAMGKPVLMGVRGESAAIIEDSGAGLSVEPQNVEAVAQAMVHMAGLPRAELDAMGTRARMAYEARFSFASALSEIDGHLADVIAKASVSAS